MLSIQGDFYLHKKKKEAPMGFWTVHELSSPLGKFWKYGNNIFKDMWA